MTSEYDNYIDIIINYWFKNNDFDRWFKSGDKYDSEITQLFYHVLIEAEKGNLLHWLESRKGYLAHIILLDQFSRQIYRGTPSAYKNDNKIKLFMEMGLELYLDSFDAIKKMFILMPYQHSESLKDQKKGLKILKNLIKNEKINSERNILNTALYHQKGHLDVLKKFGRFPKRNSVLKRKSTKKEIKYINQSTEHPY